jgi:hypothetical protein
MLEFRESKIKKLKNFRQPGLGLQVLYATIRIFFPDKHYAMNAEISIKKSERKTYAQTETSVLTEGQENRREKNPGEIPGSLTTA